MQSSKACFLHPVQTVGATQGVGGLGVCEDRPLSSFTGIQGLAECSPGRKEGGCERMD